jgi:arylsulfatase A-like enzyme
LISRIVLCCVVWAPSSCGAGQPTAQTPRANVLFLLVDDLGLEQVSAWGEPSAPSTPNIDRLAAEGIRFDRAYVYPYCSPTRAALLTGQEARRNGIGAITNRQRYGLPEGAPSIARLAQEAGYATSMMGKWHLSRIDDWDHPGAFGWEWFAGTMMNPQDHSKKVRGKTGYYRFEKNVNGEPRIVQRYLTTDTTDDALARIEAMPEPWLAWVAYNAPHIPTDLPPADLHDGTFDASAPDKWRHRAVVQALDAEIGRLLASMDPTVRARTTIIFLSDNGSPGHRTFPPVRFDRVKGKLFEKGIRVPMIVAGAGVGARGATTDVIFQPWDLLSTFAEIADVDPDVLEHPSGGAYVFDGRSVLPWIADPSREGDRRYAFSEQFSRNGPPPYTRYDQRAVRDERYKLIRNGTRDVLYDLGDHPYRDGEAVRHSRSAGHRKAFKRLKKALDAHYSSIEFDDYLAEGADAKRRPRRARGTKAKQRAGRAAETVTKAAKRPGGKSSRRTRRPSVESAPLPEPARGGEDDPK